MKNEQRQQKIDEINSQFDFCKKLVVEDFKQSANQWDKYPWINKQSLSEISGCGFGESFETGKYIF